MLDISQKSYSNIENAGNAITIETVDKIAKVLNVSFNKILELNADAIFNKNSQHGGLSQLNNAPSYNYLNEKQNELYEKLLLEKDERIKQFEELIKLKNSIIAGKPLKK